VSIEGPTAQRGAAATVALIIAAVIWGFAFVAQRAGMAHVGPFTFNGVRFLLGSLALLPLVRVRRRAGSVVAGRETVLAGGAAGLVLFVAASLQQVGIVHTTAGKAGFITGLYVVIVPLIGRLRGQPIGRTVAVGSIAALAGLYLLSVPPARGFAIGLGDGLLLASALGWAIHVHAVGWLAERVPPVGAACVQFAVCGAASLLAAVAFESIEIAGIARAAVPILYAGILSTGVAYTLQIVGQQRIDPARAGIILSLEAVFAVIGGWLLLSEPMTARGLLGGALMIVGMILAQLRGDPRLRPLGGLFPRQRPRGRARSASSESTISPQSVNGRPSSQTELSRD